MINVVNSSSAPPPSRPAVISINNDSTTEQVLRFVSGLAKSVPMRACHHPKAEKNSLCAKTAALEEFVFTFAET